MQCQRRRGNLLMALDTAPLAPCLTMRLTGAMSSAPYLEGQTRGENSGGSLEHPRQWLGAQWLGLFLKGPSCPEPLGEAQRASGATAKAAL